jgi:citrate synthase
MFAIPRTSGWIAQWLEMVVDKEQKIARPRQIYTGERWSATTSQLETAAERRLHRVVTAQSLR